MRLFFLFIFYYLDNFQMTEFVQNIINFLLIHESLVMVNFVILKGYVIYSKLFLINEENQNDNIPFPIICKYLNSLNNM